ncbi:MAG: M56 family metallopeptidase [Bacteroidales bacterium]|jgi:TonB family protein|nr:M56 family metallopeptidase [Bacteroidales bacterium]
MDFLFIYLIKSSLSLTILYVSYEFFFRKEAYFKFSRYFLLFTLLVVIIIPLIPYNATQIVSVASLQLSEVIIRSGIPSFTLDEVVIRGQSPSGTLIDFNSFYTILFIVYIAGVLFKSLQFIFRLLQIRRLVSRSKTLELDGLIFVLTKKGSPTFSFMNWIFIDRELFKKKEEIEGIISHERIHSQQGHTYDLIIAEILTIIQWFNPLAYLLKKTIKENHEYITDHEVIENYQSMEAYQLLLVHHSSGIRSNVLTHNFSYSLLKRRLHMMRKSKHPLRFALGMLFIATTMVVIFFACSSPDKKQVDPTGEVSKDTEATFEVVEVMPEYPGGMGALIDYLGSNIKYPEQAKKDGIEGKVFVNFVIEKDGSVGETKVLRGIGGGCDEEAMRVVSEMPYWSPGMQRGQAVRVSYNLPISFKLDEKDKDTIFTVVEEMPEFPGGTEALFAYISKNIKYPAKAKKEKIQRRVFISFVVEKSGKVSNVNILRGIGGGCDEESLRVVTEMPVWKPGLQDGKPVRVQYNLPIKFALD